MSRKPQTIKKQSPVEQAKKQTPAPMGKDHQDVLEGLTGNYLYTGATLWFECRKGEEHNLIKGRDYDIAKLPRHELIANAILRRFLVKSDAKKEA